MPDRGNGMRIAWMGPPPNLGGGVAEVGHRLLEGLCRAGAEVDCFTTSEVGAPPSFPDAPSLRVHVEPLRWEWDRFYSQTALTQFITKQQARSWAQRTLLHSLLATHRRRRFDVLLRFSQIELMSLGRRLEELPPVVLQPAAHAAGELRWHRREAGLATETVTNRAVVRTMLQSRARLQRRDLHRAAAVIAPSQRFADALAHDCGLERSAIGVVPFPIDIGRFRPDHGVKAGRDRLRILFVSRLAVRKGVEMVVALSNRLADLAMPADVTVVGSDAMWSDYRPLLADLAEPVATYIGWRSQDDIARLLRDSDIALVPSHYEPFGLTAAEALASGTPVVASDVVGAVEGIDRRCVVTFADGDVDAMVGAVRSIAEGLRQDPGIRKLARSEAVRAFDRDVASAALLEVLAATAARARRL